MFLSKITDLILDLIYPPSCMVCKKSLQIGMENTKCGICDDCFPKLQLNARIINLKVQRHLVPILVLFDYEEELKTIITDFKFENSPINAKYLMNLLSYSICKNGNSYSENLWNNEDNNSVLTLEEIREFFSDVEALIPAPIHRKRYLERGYNQSYLLAQELSLLTEIPIYNKAIIKVRDTEKQSTLSAADRRINLKNAFKVGKDGDNLLAKNIMIVDDVTTTGTTIKEILEELQECQLGTMKAFVIASTANK